MPEDMEKILFAVDNRGHIMPIYASGPSVEWHVYEDTETDWNDINIDGIPAAAGFYVWEGFPKAEMETEEGAGTYCIGYEYSNSWRPLDQIEWLSLMEGVCPWSSRKNEEQEFAYDILKNRADYSGAKLDKSLYEKSLLDD